MSGILYPVIGTYTKTVEKEKLIDSDIVFTNSSGEVLSIGDIVQIDMVSISSELNVRFDLELIEGSISFRFKSVNGSFYNVPVASFSEITINGGLFNIWGINFNKSFKVSGDIELVSDSLSLIRISETWKQVDEGKTLVYTLANSNCVKFTEPVGLGLTLADFGIRIDHDWSICFYLKDNRTTNHRNIILNAGAFTICSLPNLNGGQLVIGTNEASTGTWFCETPRFVEGLFVLVYSAQEKRLRIYYNNQLSLNETKENLSWDASQEVFLAKTRFQVFWDTPSDFNMAGFGIFQRVLSEAEIQEYYRHVIPDNSKVFYPMAEGFENLLYDVSTFPVFLSNSNCATFDGENDHISVEPNTDFEFGIGDFALSLRINFNSIKSGRNIFFDQAGVNQRALQFEYNSTQIIRLGLPENKASGTSWDYADFACTLSVDTDYYIAAYRKSGITYLYINGSLIGISNGLDGTNQDTGSTAPIIIGALVATTSLTYYHIDGRIWDVKITKGALSPSDETAIQNGDMPSSSNLSLHLPLSEGAGSTAYDVSGSGNHGTINANLSSFWGARQDKFHYNLLKGHSKYMQFDDGKIVSVASSTDFNFQTSDEFSFRYKISGITGSASYHVLGRGTSSPNYYGFAHGIISSNITTYIGTGSAWFNTGVCNRSLINDGNQHEVIYTWNNGASKVWIDGVKVADESDAASLADASSAALLLGAYFAAGSSDLKGVLSDVRIFNKALSTEEVATLSGGTEVTDGLVASYDGYGNTDADWIDQSGNSNDGMVAGSPTNIRIPALVDAAADAAGGFLLNPAWDVENNESETTIAKNIELGTGTVLASVGWDKQNHLHYNLFHGFTQDGTVKIPAAGLNFDYEGNPITNNPWDGIHNNGSESYWQNI